MLVRRENEGKDSPQKMIIAKLEESKRQTMEPFKALRIFLGASWRTAFAGTILGLAGAAVAIAMPIVAGAILKPGGA